MMNADKVLKMLEENEWMLVMDFATDIIGAVSELRHRGVPFRHWFFSAFALTAVSGEHIIQVWNSLIPK